jgi:FtsP/CotA-like multicopper oxidase with cupredoxin domain
MIPHRRGFLKAAGAGCIMAAAPRMSWPTVVQSREPADYTLRIATGLVELGAQQIVSTTLYNGQFPGPLLHFKEGKPVTVDVHNDT